MQSVRRFVPGRKTDVTDAAWLCQLAEAGLLKASFVPPKPIRQLRNLTRYRKTQIHERQREVNRLHKALEDTGIKLDCVAADIMGKSGARHARRAGRRARPTPTCSPSSRAGRCARRSRSCARRSPATSTRITRCWIGAILAHIDFLDEQIERLSDAIEEQIAPFRGGR